MAVDLRGECGVNRKSVAEKIAGGPRKASRRTASPDASVSLKEAAHSEREGIRLGFLIHDVSRMRRNAYDQIMKPLGVTRARWWVLAHLSRQDGIMQTQLADVLDVGKASLG